MEKEDKKKILIDDESIDEKEKNIEEGETCEESPSLRDDEILEEVEEEDNSDNKDEQGLNGDDKSNLEEQNNFSHNKVDIESCGCEDDYNYSAADEDDVDVDENEGNNENGDMENDDENKKMLFPMIPLRGITIFPKMVLHFDVAREKSINALEKAMISEQRIFLSTQKDDRTDLPTQKDFYATGTIAKVKQILKLPNDSVRVLVEGIDRGNIIEIISESPFFKCTVEKIEEEEVYEPTPRQEALKRMVLSKFDEYLSLNETLTNDIFLTVETIDGLGNMADIIASHLNIKVEKKQEILESFDVEERFHKLDEILAEEIEILNIKEDISSKTKVVMNKNQKEYYLREQMKIIQEELGMDEDLDEEIDKWKAKLKKLKLSKQTEKKIQKEIKRFGLTQPSSAEASVIRTYVETIIELPWNNATKNKNSIVEAEAILDQDHYGLKKVKERVLEYLSVVELSKKVKGPILCLVGPPGTGKTSIAKSIARATSRDFIRMSLGGVRDEAEIRGHRRTYIGAIPGRVINGVKEAGSSNPVFLFDEVDKIGADFKGDPASALLEVLDPEQNKEFMDHYLEVPFDLSKVMFIATANTTSTIPRPLLDRMEVIEVTGYTEEEKLNIAHNYLIPKKITEHGLKAENVNISKGAIKDIINYYTRESGVRNLEREIANLCRKIAKRTLAEEKTKFDVTTKNLPTYLGKKRFRFDIIEGSKEVGVTTGLAWTAVGGDTLFIETVEVAGNGTLVLTGQMGDVMQESAKTAFSYIKSKSKEFNIDLSNYKEKNIHMHIPEGAIPKDGPSAGVTMSLAMISTLTGKPARQDIAMTGEISLRGHVLPVGGIREKVMAAHRAGIRKVLLPFENEKDIEEIPEKVRKDIEFVLLKTVEDAVKEVIEK